MASQSLFGRRFETRTRFSGGIVALACASAMGQSVTIDLTGLQVKDNVNDRRDSTPDTIAAGPGYLYNIQGNIQGVSGLAALLIPEQSIADFLDSIDPGQSRLLSGAVRNAGSALPTNVYRQRFNDSILGIDLDVTFILGIEANGTAFFESRDVSIGLPTITGHAEMTSGTAQITSWIPTPPVQTEWHFDADLAPAPDSTGPAQMRYMDDPAFAPMPLGNTPGVTQAQSAFGTTTSFAIGSIAGAEATVYRVSPPRDLTDPGNADRSRSIGVAIWPNTRDFFPDEKIGQWTMILDLYIPASSFAAQFPATILQTKLVNELEADIRIHNDPVDGPGIGFMVDPIDFIRSPLIAPDTWMRLAIVSDGYITTQSRVFIDGTLIGTTSGDWIYNTTDHTDPRFGDGEAVPPADWSSWGQFPNPWAASTGGALMAGTSALFADGTGLGEQFYIANLYLTDDLLTDAQVAALGGPDASGIVFTGASCPADLSGSADPNNPSYGVPDGLVDANDFFYYLAQFDAGNLAQADLTGSIDPNNPAFGVPDGTLDANDFFFYLQLFAQGCP